MTDIMEIYSEVVDEDMTMAEKQEAIRQSDKLHFAGIWTPEAAE